MPKAWLPSCIQISEYVPIGSGGIRPSVMDQMILFNTKYDNSVTAFCGPFGLIDEYA